MKHFRFSLRMLLVIMALVAVYIVGHKNGFRKGYSKAAVERGDGMLGSYDVSDLVLPISEEQQQVLQSPGYERNSGD